MNNQRESVRKICAALNKHQVDFLLIGGMAVAYHGFERSTEDVDFWYKPSTENFHRLIAALAELKVDVSELTGLIFDPKKAYLRIPSLGLLVPHQLFFDKNRGAQCSFQPRPLISINRVY